MLHDKFPDPGKYVLPHNGIKLYPDISERDKWDNLGSDLKGKIVKAGERLLSHEWKNLNITGYLDYSRNGNRSRYEQLYFEKRSSLGFLVIAECVENKGRFIDDIINGIWSICEETSWVLPAHIAQYTDETLPDIATPVIDLFAAETGALISSVYFLLRICFDEISTNINKRIIIEINKRILDPYLAHDDFWWMCLTTLDRGVNNWNPWCNSNCLLAFTLMERDRSRLLEAIKKCMKSLDVFIDSYHDDGGCDEGPSYWTRAGGSLFDCLEILFSASNGKINIYNENKIRNIGRYIYQCHIHENYFINFADGDAKINVPANLIYRYGKIINDEHLTSLGLYLSGLQSFEDMFDYCFSMFRSIKSIFDYHEIPVEHHSAPYVKDVWLDGIQVMTIRHKPGSNEGLFLAVKGGNNNESHNHNDVGQFIIYSDGYPVIIDVGVETYTGKTFGPDRYEIWTMQSAFHNLPTINKIQQHNGWKYKADNVKYESDGHISELSMNIDNAYPPEAGMLYWKRTARIEGSGKAYIEIIDDFELEKNTDDIILSLITCCNMAQNSSGQIIFQCLKGKNILMEYDHNKISHSIEIIDIKDERLKKSWGDTLYRLLLKPVKPVMKDIWILKFYSVD